MSSSDSDSDSSVPMKKSAPVAVPSKPSTALPPVRPPASAQKFQSGAGTGVFKDGKQLTKQQLNQKIALEKRTAQAKQLGITVEELCKREKENKGKSKKKKQEEKKRKQPEPSSSSSSDSSDSDSDSGSDEDEQPKKAAKVEKPAAPAPATSSTTSATASSTSSTNAPSTKKDKGAELREAKRAAVEAKRAARALKKEKKRSQLEAQGRHPTQIDLQLMGRDLAATKLWELYQQDRKERDQEMTPIELDEQLHGKCIASIPNHESLDSHSFKMLYKHLKSMYGGNYQEQVCGGTIQPALSTKKERLDAKIERRTKLQEGKEEEVEEEIDDEVKQKQQHMDDPNIGAPYIVFITPSAIRATEIGRAFKKIPMNTRVVKLFAKHLKIDQQREELSHDVRVCIGTPHRLVKLSQNGYLKWNRCRLIIWDIGKTRKLVMAEMQEARRRKNKLKKLKKEGGGEDVDMTDINNEPIKVDGKDRKMFTLLTMKDTKSELWKLYEQYLHEVVVKKQTAKLVLL